MRFTIRDLAWLTIVAAMGLGWWLHSQRQEARSRQLQADLVAQADLVDQFISVVTDLDCEVQSPTEEYAKVLVPQSLQGHFHSQGRGAPISFTLSAPRWALKRNIEGEFDRLRIPSP